MPSYSLDILTMPASSVLSSNSTNFFDAKSKSSDQSAWISIFLSVLGITIAIATLLLAFLQYKSYSWERVLVAEKSH